MLKWLWPVQEPITLYELHYWEDGSDNKVRQIWTYPFFLFVFFFCLSVIGLHTGGYSSVWFRAMTENQRRSKLTFLHRGPGANAWESFREDESCRLFAFFLNKKKKGKTKTGRSNQFPLTTDPPIQVLAKTRTPCGGDVGKIGPCWEQMPSERSDRSLFR